MLSVLIVNWNTRDFLRACLSSLERFPSHLPMEVVVVDNASTDGSAQMVETEFPRVNLIRQDVNLGYAEGNNIAFRLSSGEWILTLNPDTEVFENTLDEAIRTMITHPMIGALGARQIGLDTETQRSVRGFPSILGIFGDLTGLGRIFGGSLDSYRMTRFDYGKPGPAPQPMGTFLLFRRSAIEATTGGQQLFDPSFPIFFNEVDLLRRMADTGWGAYYSPNVRILHHGGESTKQVRPNMIWESHLSLIRYGKKHFAKGLGKVLFGLVAGLIWLSALVRAKGIYGGFRT